MLGALVDQSLLQRAEGPDGEPWFLMLETVREFGLEMLAASGEVAITRDCHAAYYAAFAEEAEHGLRTADAPDWMIRVDADLHNVRAGTQWCTDAGRIDLAAKLLPPLAWYWTARGLMTEARHRSEAILALPMAARSTASRAHLLRLAGGMAELHGDVDAARSRLEESVAIWREIGDQAHLAQALASLAWSLLGDLQAAWRAAEESKVLFREVGDHWSIGFALHTLATIAMRERDDDRAAALAQESAALFRMAGDPFSAVEPLTNLAALAERRGDYPTARALFEECLRAYRLAGHMADVTATLMSLALLWLRQGDTRQAAGLLHESLTISRQLGSAGYVASPIEVIAGAAQVSGQAAQTARLFGAAAAVRERYGFGRPRTHQRLYDATVTAVRADLGPEAYAAAWSEGHAMSADEAVSYALATIAFDEPSAVQGGDRENASPQTPAHGLPGSLSAREAEVLRLLATGCTNPEIAEQLVLSAGTVARHTANIYAKIGARGRADAVAYAARHGLIEP